MGMKKKGNEMKWELNENELEMKWE